MPIKKCIDFFNSIKAIPSLNEREIYLENNLNWFIKRILEINYSDKYIFPFKKQKLKEIKISPDSNQDNSQKKNELFQLWLETTDKNIFLQLYYWCNDIEREFLSQIIFKELNVNINLKRLCKYIQIDKFFPFKYGKEINYFSKYIIEPCEENATYCVVEINNQFRIRKNNKGGKLLINETEKFSNLFSHLKGYNIILFGEIILGEIFISEAIPLVDFYEGYSSCKLFYRKRILENLKIPVKPYYIENELDISCFLSTTIIRNYNSEFSIDSYSKNNYLYIPE